MVDLFPSARASKPRFLGDTIAGVSAAVGNGEPPHAAWRMRLDV
jgi:hypothetical protein